MKVFLAVPVGFYMSGTSLMEEFYKEMQTIYNFTEKGTTAQLFSKILQNFMKIIIVELRQNRSLRVISSKSCS